MAVPLCCRAFKSYLKRQRFYRHYSTGYVILLPEINPNIPEENPLLKDGLPDFSDITAEKCVNTLGKKLLDFEHEVYNIDMQLKKTDIDEERTDSIVDNGSDYNFFNKIILPLQRTGVALDTTWAIIKSIFLTDDKGILSTKQYFSLHNRAHKAQYSKFSSRAIYEASKECNISQLSEEEQRVVERYRLEGKLNGYDLSRDHKDAFDNIHKKICLEKKNFSERIKLTKEFVSMKVQDPSIIRCLPSNLVAKMSEQSTDPTAGPWVAATEAPVRDKFLEYCPDSSLRYRVWRNSVQVASDCLDDSSLNNSKSLEILRTLRNDQAKLLGFKTYFDMSMETKMAGSVDVVKSFLESLRSRAWSLHKKEIDELQEFVYKSGSKEKLRLPDIPYWSRVQKRALYGFENEELRDFFPLEKVFSGLTKLCEKLFNIRFELAESVNAWHPDVKFYYIFEDDSVRPVAGFYFDPFLRNGKVKTEPEQGWVYSIRAAHQSDGPGSVLPLSVMILNLPPPLYGKPSLLSYSEVQSLFGKFGKLLQQLLCSVVYTEVSGFSFVEWDTVEITSNFMQHWLEEPKVLESISGHYSSQEKLSVKDMKASNNHMCGTSICSETYKASLDIKFYTEESKFWYDIMKEIWPKHFVFPLEDIYHEPLSMNEIVTQEWCANYYSRLWARMIAADIYSAFELYTHSKF